MKKLDYFLVLAAVALVMIGLAYYKPTSESDIRGSVNQTVFYGSGTTNTSTIVNTTSTQVLPNTWTSWADIENNGTSTVFCFADGKTAASSSVAINSGLQIGGVTNSSSPFNGETSMTFGPSASAYAPYVGSVNCIAAQKTVVGVVYN